jgi:CheY-like chemotaxis protein
VRRFATGRAAAKILCWASLVGVSKNRSVTSQGSVLRPSVLVVEDDEDLCTVVVDLLRDEGFDAESARNGSLAVEKLEAGAAPSVILLDLMMPVMSGWQLWDWLQQHRAFRHIPVVIFTATGLRTGSLGKVPVVEKPFDPQKLIDTLATLTPRAA